MVQVKRHGAGGRYFPRSPRAFSHCARFASKSFPTDPYRVFAASFRSEALSLRYRTITVLAVLEDHASLNHTNTLRDRHFRDVRAGVR